MRAEVSEVPRSDPIVLRTATVAGLFEVLAIGADATLTGTGRGLTAFAALCAIAALQVAVWWGLARVLPRRWSPARRLRAVSALWALAVVAGRLGLARPMAPEAVVPLLAGVALLQFVPETKLRAEDRVGALLAGVAAVAIGITSLWGLLASAVPEPFLLGGAALAALGVTAAGTGRPLVALGIAATGLGALLWPVDPPPSSGRPNVLWILVDTLRRDHVPPLGDLVASPGMTQLADEGVLFEDAVAVVPKTPASVASYLTGQLPQRHGVRTLYSPLGDAPRTAAERFAAAGYRTGALVQNGWISARRGFGQGFARFSDHADLNAGFGLLDRSSWVRLVDRATVRRIPPFDPQTDADVATDAAIAQFQAWDRSRPFFLYVHYFEPHWPYRPPEADARRHGAPPDGDVAVNRVPEGRRGHLIFQNDLPEAENDAARRLYRAEVDHTLASVGRLVGALDRLELAADTIVVFCADHGHSLGEHAYHFHHGAFLYEPDLRVPLILRWPGRIPAGARVGGTVRSIDVLPTLLELAGIEAGSDLDGESLVPLWSGTSGSREAFIESDVKMFVENTRREVYGIPGVLRGLRADGWKLVLTPTPKGPRYELYDLTGDPGETRDLASDPAHAAHLEAMRARLLAHVPAEEREAIAAGPGAAPPDAAPVDDEALEQLRALGYAN